MVRAPLPHVRLQKALLLWVAADAAATGERLVSLQREIGLPRTYGGFPAEWNPREPRDLLDALEGLPAPLGGRVVAPAGEVSEAGAEGAAGEAAAAEAAEADPVDVAWTTAKEVVALENRVRLEAQQLQDAMIKCHGKRLTQYLLDDVMPSVTAALLKLTDPHEPLPEDVLDFIGNLMITRANERVEENIDPYASPLYTLRS